MLMASTTMRLLLLLALAAFLNGCSTTKELLSFDSVDKKAEAKQQTQEIDEHLEEWNALKPRLTEIVKLESELRYLIDQISATELSNEQSISIREPVDNQFKDPSFSMSKEIEAALEMAIEPEREFEQGQDEEMVASFDTESNQALISTLDTESEQALVDKFEQADEQSVASNLNLAAVATPPESFVAPSRKTLLSTNPSSDVQLGRAAPVGSGQNNNIDAKFSSSAFDTGLKDVSRNLKNPVQRTPAQLGVSDNKFTNVSNQRSASSAGVPNSQSAPALQTNLKAATSAIVGPTRFVESACTSPSNPALGGPGIHLASYSSFDNAQKAWAGLQTKYAKQLCDKRAAVNQVNVKGKQYFAIRIGPFASNNAAQNACADFLSTGQYCQRSVFEGAILP